jgi:hypothetical protein
MFLYTQISLVQRATHTHSDRVLSNSRKIVPPGTNENPQQTSQVVRMTVRNQLFQEPIVSVNDHLSHI